MTPRVWAAVFLVLAVAAIVAGTATLAVAVDRADTIVGILAGLELATGITLGAVAYWCALDDDPHDR